MTEQTIELRIPSRLASIEEAAAAAAKVFAETGFGEEAVFGMDLAVREAVANAILHGNRQDEAKFVEVRFIPSASALTIEVRDQGAGFDPDAVPDPTDADHLLRASGRGILFMRTFMDRINWSQHPEGGTVVRMAKTR